MEGQEDSGEAEVCPLRGDRVGGMRTELGSRAQEKERVSLGGPPSRLPSLAQW